MRRPRVKPEHRPHRFPDGTIRIGGEVYGIAAEINDPHGWVWAALDRLDGIRSPTEIVSELQVLFPALGSAGASGILEGLLASGYVEDAAAEIPAEFSSTERERYNRNAAYFRRVDLTPREHGWEAQQRLKRARVVVLGIGGTGSHAAWALTAVGVGRIHCVDSDVVELSNLNRQVIYTESDIGRPKVEAAIPRLRQVNSNVRITGDRRRIASQDDLRDLVAGFDVLVLCADEPQDENGGIRIWANRTCSAAGVCWVGGGYAGPLLTTGVFATGGTCYECLAAGEAARRKPGMPVDLGGPGVIAPSAGICGQLIANAAITLITGVPEILPGYLRGLNLIAPDDLVFVRHPPRAECVVCNPIRESGPV